MAPKKTFFFDIDNCLYQKNTKIAQLMGDLIDKYFEQHLELTPEEAYDLHHKYYTSYGLAILGLVQHHQVDALEFNEKVDDALPLDTILKPNPSLRRLLLDIDRENVKLWLLTNAYVTHGKRVVKLLGVDDLFEGITYCDYAVKDVSKFIAKPAKAMFERAMKDAGVQAGEDCYFVDDSYINAKGAQELGWSTAHLIEPGERVPEIPATKFVIRDLEELRQVFPEVFKHEAET